MFSNVQSPNSLSHCSYSSRSGTAKSNASSRTLPNHDYPNPPSSIDSFGSIYEKILALQNSDDEQYSLPSQKNTEGSFYFFEHAPKKTATENQAPEAPTRRPRRERILNALRLRRRPAQQQTQALLLRNEEGSSLRSRAWNWAKNLFKGRDAQPVLTYVPTPWERFHSFDEISLSMPDSHRS